MEENIGAAIDGWWHLDAVSDPLDGEPEFTLVNKANGMRCVLSRSQIDAVRSGEDTVSAIISRRIGQSKPWRF